MKRSYDIRSLLSVSLEDINCDPVEPLYRLSDYIRVGVIFKIEDQILEDSIRNFYKVKKKKIPTYSTSMLNESYLNDAVT